jgi:hypothetical protein
VVKVVPFLQPRDSGGSDATQSPWPALVVRPLLNVRRAAGRLEVRAMKYLLSRVLVGVAIALVMAAVRGAL